MSTIYNRRLHNCASTAQKKKPAAPNHTKPAEMMTLCNCNSSLPQNDHLVMDVTIGHTCSMQHDCVNQTHEEKWSRENLTILLPEHHNSQSSNSMPSPNTHVASNQMSQLERPSYSSNPAQMDDSNPPSLDLDTKSLPTPTRGRRRRRKSSSSPPLSPAPSSLYQRPRTHTYASHFLSILTIAPPS